MSCAASRERNLGRRRDAQQLGRECDRHALRGRLVIGDVEDAVGAARESRIDRLRDVGDVDAIEHLARPVDPLRAAARNLHAARSVRAHRCPRGAGSRPPCRRGRRVPSRPARLRAARGCAAIPAPPASPRRPRRRHDRHRRRRSRDRRSCCRCGARRDASRRNVRSTGSPLSSGGTEIRTALASITAAVTSGAASRRRTRKPRPCARRCPRPRSRPPSRACAPCRRCGRTRRRTRRCRCEAE